MPTDPADMALAALALVESSIDDNAINRNVLLDMVDAADLIVGLVTLAASMRCSLAAAWGIDTATLDELLRAHFSLHPLDFGHGVA